MQPTCDETAQGAAIRFRYERFRCSCRHWFYQPLAQSHPATGDPARYRADGFRPKAPAVSVAAAEIAHGGKIGHFRDRSISLSVRHENVLPNSREISFQLGPIQIQQIQFTHVRLQQSDVMPRVSVLCFQVSVLAYAEQTPSVPKKLDLRFAAVSARQSHAAFFHPQWSQNRPE